MPKIPIVPFQMLCAVFNKHWVMWCSQYKTAKQHTPNHGGYHSECVFVPRREVWAKIYQMYGGGGISGNNNNSREIIHQNTPSNSPRETMQTRTESNEEWLREFSSGSPEI